MRGSRLVALIFASLPAFGTAQDAAPGPARTQASDRDDFIARLSELAKSAPKPEPLAGDHWIRGRVFTSEGAPLAGVLVRAMNSNPEQTLVDRNAFADGPEDGTLARSLRASASWWFTRWQNTWETTTAADGTYSFDHLAGDRFDLEAWRAGFSVDLGDSAWRRRMNVECDETVDFVAYATVRHQVVVRMPDGSTPPRVTLQFDRVGGRSAGILETWTSDDPFVTIPSGEWKITAYSGDPRSNLLSLQDAWFASPAQSVSVRPTADGDRTGGNIELSMRGIPAIEGSVHMSAREPARSFEVVAVALAEGQEPDPKRLADSSATRTREVVRASVHSGSQWGTRYRISKIDPGRWLVGVREWGLAAPLVTSVVAVGDGLVLHDFTLPPRTPDSELLVRVLDPAGALLRQCEFEANVSRDDRSGSRTGWSGAIESRPTLDGGFAFSRDRLGTSCTLFATLPNLGTRAVDVPLDAKELVVKFEAPATPRLVLSGIAEHARDVRVAVELSFETGATRDPKAVRIESGAIAGDGTIDIGKVQPGSLRVQVYVAHARPGTASKTSESEVAAAVFKLASGPRELSLPFPELGTVKVAVGLKQRGSYTLVRTDAPQEVDRRARREATQDDDGILTFADVPPGTFELRGSNGASMLIETPVSEVVRFGADPIRVLRVVIRDPKGAHARAGLKEGDRIVAIDGREFESRDELLRIRQSLKGETVTLTVQRKDERFEIEIETRLVTGAGDPGGYFLEAAR